MVELDQREIKFRAWDKHYKVMSNIKSLHFDNGICQLYNDNQCNRFFDSFVIMQYIGLRDKNSDEETGICFDFSYSDIYDFIKLLEKLKKGKAVLYETT